MVQSDFERINGQFGVDHLFVGQLCVEFNHRVVGVVQLFDELQANLLEASYLRHQLASGLAVARLVEGVIAHQFYVVGTWQPAANRLPVTNHSLRH